MGPRPARRRAAPPAAFVGRSSREEARARRGLRGGRGLAARRRPRLGARSDQPCRARGGGAGPRRGPAGSEVAAGASGPCVAGCGRRHGPAPRLGNFGCRRGRPRARGLAPKLGTRAVIVRRPRARRGSRDPQGPGGRRGVGAAGCPGRGAWHNDAVALKTSVSVSLLQGELADRLAAVRLDLPCRPQREIPKSTCLNEWVLHGQCSAAHEWRCLLQNSRKVDLWSFPGLPSFSSGLHGRVRDPGLAPTKQAALIAPSFQHLLSPVCGALEDAGPGPAVAWSLAVGRCLPLCGLGPTRQVTHLNRHLS